MSEEDENLRRRTVQAACAQAACALMAAWLEGTVVADEQAAVTLVNTLIRCYVEEGGIELMLAGLLNLSGSLLLKLERTTGTPARVLLQEYALAEPGAAP